MAGGGRRSLLTEVAGEARTSLAWRWRTPVLGTEKCGKSSPLRLAVDCFGVTALVCRRTEGHGDLPYASCKMFLGSRKAGKEDT